MQKNSTSVLGGGEKTGGSANGQDLSPSPGLPPLELAETVEFMEGLSATGETWAGE